MKKIVLGLFLATLVGCASNSDVAKIQSQTDELKVSIEPLVATIAEAKRVALDANTKASAANYWAVVAENNTKEIQQKLDALFKQSQLK